MAEFRMPILTGPDLAVTAVDVVEVAPRERNGPGDRFRVVATVANVGTGPAPASVTAIEIAGNGHLDVISAATPVVGPGESVEVAVSWDVRGLRGAFTVTAVANAAREFWELDIGNNVASVVVEVHGNRATVR